LMRAQVLRRVGSMAVQSVQDAGGVTLQQPTTASVSGAVNFYLVGCFEQGCIWLRKGYVD